MVEPFLELSSVKVRRSCNTFCAEKLFPFFKDYGRIKSEIQEAYSFAGSPASGKDGEYQ